MAEDFIIDERKSDIYFGNSIKTDRQISHDRLQLIKKKLKHEQYSNNETRMSQELNFKLAYNETYGYYSDGYEAYLQLANEGSGWQVLGIFADLALSRVTKGIKASLTAEIVEKLVDSWGPVSEAAVRMAHDTDLKVQIQSRSLKIARLPYALRITSLAYKYNLKQEIIC